MHPKHRIWLETRAISQRLGYDTYDYLPGDEAAYPFVFIGEQFKQSARDSKDSDLNRTQVTVHVWHDNPRQRGTLTHMMDQIETNARAVKNLSGLTVEVLEADDQVIPDNSTGKDLMHGILEINYEYY